MKLFTNLKKKKKVHQKNGEGKKDDNVVDADFEEVKEDFEEVKEEEIKEDKKEEDKEKSA